MPRCQSPGTCALIVAAGLTVAAQTPALPVQTPPRDGAPAPAAGTASISGRVVQLETDQPVRRVQITARGSDASSQVYSAITDTEGRFELTKVAAGRYQLAAAKAGYVTLQHGQRRPLEGFRRSAIGVDLVEGESRPVDLRIF